MLAKACFRHFEAVRTMAEKIPVTIRIERAETDRLGQIVDDLKTHGLESVETHERFMIVNGNANSSSLDGLRSVKGVASVREDSVYKTQAQ